MKIISLITCSFNSQETIGQAIDSVQCQSYQHIQHIFVDGASADATVDVISEKVKSSELVVSEPDTGIYNAFNKGVARSTGDIVGFLHSDDQFASSRVLERVAEAFDNDSIDAVYGDLVLVKRHNRDQVVRYWKGGEFTTEKLRNGWMPPHPTLFVRRDIMQRLRFDENLKISADYDFILRLFLSGTLNVKYLPHVFVKMGVGGESTKSLRNIVLKMREDFRVARGVGLCGARVLVLKNLRKLPQLWQRVM